MPRKYDCLVRFYASWFADLTNESKGFSFDEIGQILLKIAEAQIKGDAEIIQNLPITIKRGLQMATLEEQITRLIERSARCKERGSIGGQVTAQRSGEREKQEKAEREKMLGVQRELEKSRRENIEKKRDYDIALFHKVCNLAGIEPNEITRKQVDITIYRRVWEEDIMKGKLEFPEWLIYHGLKTSEQVKKIYKNFLTKGEE